MMKVQIQVLFTEEIRLKVRNHRERSDQPYSVIAIEGSKECDVTLFPFGFGHTERVQRAVDAFNREMETPTTAETPRPSDGMSIVGSGDEI